MTSSNGDHDPLAQFRLGSAVCIDRLSEVIEKCDAVRKELKSSHPEWKARPSTDHVLSLDVRSEFFWTAYRLCQSGQLSYFAVAELFGHPSWWRAKQPNIQMVPTATESLVDHLVTVKLGMLLSLAIALEEFFRSLLRNVDDFTASPDGRFANLYPHVLSRTGLSKFIPLLDVIREVRNTQHSNGLYMPESGKTCLTLEYAGRRFEFQRGQMLNWLGEETAIWLIGNVVEAIGEIVRHPFVAGAETCPRADGFA